MFDVATRPLPESLRGGGVFGMPFDWRLAKPAAPRDYPYTDFSSPTGLAQSYVERLATYALELEDTLQTGVILSIFTDARASADDKLPLNETNRRGWVGDEFMSDGFSDRPDNWGTLLWLLYTGKVTDDVPAKAVFTVKEGLAWLVRAGIADRIEVTAQWVGDRADRLAIRPQIFKPGQITPVYDVLWGTSIRRFAT